MSQNTKKLLSGFTLVEMLISIVVVGILSLVSMRMIYNMTSYRSKQFAIEDTDDSFRNFISNVSGSVKSAHTVAINSVDIPNDTINISGDSFCVSYRLVGTTIKKSDGITSPCNTDYKQILEGNIQITKFTPTTAGNSLNIKIEGIYKDPVGVRPFLFDTTVTKRLYD